MAEEIVGLRATTEGALKFVLCVETDPENSPHIGSWSREGHAAAIASPVFWHLLILQDDLFQGYLIARIYVQRGRAFFSKELLCCLRSAVWGGRQSANLFNLLARWGHLAFGWRWMLKMPGPNERIALLDLKRWFLRMKRWRVLRSRWTAFPTIAF